MYSKLKEEMQRQHVTGYGLSKRTGISCSDIYSALNGKKFMFPGWKQRIAEALGQSVESLFPGTDEVIGDE